MSDQHNIFISHRHEDDALVGDLKKMLAGSGAEIRDSSITSETPNNAKSPDYIRQILADQIRWAGKIIVVNSPIPRTTSGSTGRSSMPGSSRTSGSSGSGRRAPRTTTCPSRSRTTRTRSSIGMLKRSSTRLTVKTTGQNPAVRLLLCSRSLELPADKGVGA